MTDALMHAVSILNDRFLGYVLLFALLAAGVYFSFATRWVQCFNPKELLFLLVGRSHKKGHISPFQAFAISTASRVGTGNIAGVALAITLGGPGAIFWMWVIAVCGAASSFVESTLAQVYKVPTAGHFRGGPAYYMQYALGMRKLALAFSVIITLTFAFTFNSVQANTIAHSLQTAFQIPLAVTGFLVTAFSALIIFGGLRRIAQFSAVIVPVFALGYILITLIVMLLNIPKLPGVLALIFTDAFTWHKVAGGTLGATIMIGARRGLFSNEAGMGSAPNAAATANTSHPAKQGYVQAFGVFVDTLLICSCTAFIVLLSDYQATPAQGIALTQFALTSELGNFGNYFLTASVLLFAFTSIIGNYYYGQANVEFVTTGKKALFLFRVGVCGMIFLGAIAQLNLVWNIADVFMTVMALMNLYAIFRLRRQALDVLADYRRQKLQGEDPVFYPENVPSVGKTYAWHSRSHLEAGPTQK